MTRNDRAKSRISSLARLLVRGVSSLTMAVVATLSLVGWLVAAIVTDFPSAWVDVLFGVSAATTFVMVFFIQHATRRDTRAIILKLDELVESHRRADNAVVDVESRPLSEQEKMDNERHHHTES